MENTNATVLTITAALIQQQSAAYARKFWSMEREADFSYILGEYLFLKEWHEDPRGKSCADCLCLYCDTYLRKHCLRSTTDFSKFLQV